MINGAFPSTRIAGPQEDRQEFSFAQRLRSLVEKLFSGPVFLRPIFNGSLAVPNHETPPAGDRLISRPYRSLQDV